MRFQVRLVLLAVVLVGRGVLAAEVVRERYGSEMLGGMTVEATVDFLMGVHEFKSPIELCCCRLSEQIPEGMAVAVLHAGASDTWSSLQIRFDEDDKITSFMIVPAKRLGIIRGWRRRGNS